MNIRIHQERLTSEIEALAQISDADPPAVTRIVFSEKDRQARQWLLALCTASGLVVRQDAVGNTFARWNGANASAAAVATGSHIDAIPNAGKYDGVVGVLGGLEAIRALQGSAFHPTRSIELILFTSEEPTRFGIGCLGSRMLSGALTANTASELRDSAGETLEHVRRNAGITGELDSVRLAESHYHAFIELHIEQGPLLEQAGIPLGIVESIAAPASFEIIVEGAGGHAGAVLMPVRKDALCAAAEIILLIESAARSSGSPDTVATVGICEVFPGAVNSIPSRVRFTLDLRDTDLLRRDRVFTAIQDGAKAIAGSRLVSIQFHTVNADAPAACDRKIVDALARAASKHNFPHIKMVSRAYHDSLFMSRIVPTAMLFIPCQKGYSHRPDEYASPEDIARGTLVLAETLAELAS